MAYEFDRAALQSQLDSLIAGRTAMELRLELSIAMIEARIRAERMEYLSSCSECSSDSEPESEDDESDGEPESEDEESEDEESEESEGEGE
jgi:hypothetical protein